MARSLYGLFWFFVFLAIVNSTIANANAGVNVVQPDRLRHGPDRRVPALPGPGAPEAPLPRAGHLTGFVITVAVTLGLGLGYDPVTAFVMVATALVIVLAAIYIVMNAACIGYFTRGRRQRFNPLLHVVIPVLGIIDVRPGLAHRRGHQGRSRSWPRCPRRTPTWAPGWPAGWSSGVIYLVYLYRHDPRRVVEVGLVHLDPLEEYGT